MRSIFRSEWSPPRPWTEEEKIIASLLNALMENARIMSFEEFEKYAKVWLRRSRSLVPRIEEPPEKYITWIFAMLDSLDSQVL